MSQIKAKSIQICIFTPKDLNSVNAYPHQEQYLYYTFYNILVDLVKLHGDIPVVLDFCPVAGTSNLQVLEQNGGSPLNLPAVQLWAEYADGTASQYFLKKSLTDINSDAPILDDKKALAYVQALLYRLSPTTQPILCKILPPLCSLGWYFWLGAAAYTTYRTTQARNVGKYVWGAAALLTWQGFIARGGLKELASKLTK